MHRPATTASVLAAACLLAACASGGGEGAPAATPDAAAPACKSGARRCDGDARQFCRDGRWYTVEICRTVGFCSPTLAACVLCEPGARRCQGDVAQVCDRTGKAWTSEKVCRKGLCKNGSCITPPDSTIDVEVIITADNAYGFGYGSATRMENYFGGVENRTAGEIFNCPIGRGPEAYTVPAAKAGVGDYLYIIAYADASTTQGVLGQFKRKGARNPRVYTGVGDWEVCATGKNYNPGRGGGPDIATINAEIARCNASPSPSRSGGWVDRRGTPKGRLAVGEDNSTHRGPRPTAGNEFPKVCGIDPQARWMWFDWAPGKLTPPKSPFIWPGGTGNPDGQFLIFRLKAEKIPGPK